LGRMRGCHCARNVIAGKDGVSRGFGICEFVLGIFVRRGGELMVRGDGGGDRGICDLVEEIAWAPSPEFDEIREKRVAESERNRTYST
jgi:hypothetical protein